MSRAPSLEGALAFVYAVTGLYKMRDRHNLYYELPFSLLRLLFPDFKPMGHKRANFYKCGDLTKHEHYISWNSVECEEPDFHRPEYFCELIFSEREL